MGVLGSSNKEEPMKTTSQTPDQIIKLIERAEKGEQTISEAQRRQAP
jgi:hypothetical protein